MSGSDYTLTTNLQLFKPIYNMDPEQWGAHLNSNADKLDAALGPSGVFVPFAGGTMTGPLVLAGINTAPTPVPGTNTQQLATTAFVTGALATTALAGVAQLNYVDNSGFNINQRVYASGTALAAGAYGFDRWKAGAAGATLTFAGILPGTAVTITAGSLQQVVEGQSLATGSYTMSWTGTALGRVGAGTYVASPIAVTGTGANQTIEFQAGTLSQVMLAAGTVPVTWTVGNRQQEQARCQRFYATGQLYHNLFLTAGSNYALGAMMPVTMRAVPTTAILTNASANVGTVTLSSNSAIVLATAPATVSSGGGLNVVFSASADL